MGLQLILKAVFGLILFAGILYLAYISTKYVGKRYMQGGKSSHSLEFLETYPLGRDSKLAIIKVGEKLMLVGITPHNISLVSELDESDLNTVCEQAGCEPVSFAQALKINLEKASGRTFAKAEKQKTAENKSSTEDSDNDAS